MRCLRFATLAAALFISLPLHAADPPKPAAAGPDDSTIARALLFEAGFPDRLTGRDMSYRYGTKERVLAFSRCMQERRLVKDPPKTYVWAAMLEIAKVIRQRNWLNNYWPRSRRDREIPNDVSVTVNFDCARCKAMRPTGPVSQRMRANDPLSAWGLASEAVPTLSTADLFALMRDTGFDFTTCYTLDELKMARPQNN